MDWGKAPWVQNLFVKNLIKPLTIKIIIDNIIVVNNNAIGKLWFDEKEFNGHYHESNKAADRAVSDHS
jgi:hypothetical protein